MTLYHHVAFVFPGQGAQYPGMGKDFAAQYSVARETFEEAGDLLHKDIKNLCFHGSEDALTETKNCQPAIFVDSVAILRVLQQQFPWLSPCVAAGLSLGEYTALHATGRLAFPDALEVVARRGVAMHEACETSQGGMAVVMGLEAAQVESVVSQLSLPNDLWVANFNCPGQVVVSGTPLGLLKGSAELLAHGAKRVIPLQVHGAFHSGLMRPAQEKLQPYLDQLTLHDTSVDIVMNVPGDYVSNTADIRSNLVSQVVSPVRWEDGVRAMMKAGVDLFVEIGCGSTLAGLNRRIGVTAPHISVDKVSDLQKLEAMG